MQTVIKDSKAWASREKGRDRDLMFVPIKHEILSWKELFVILV